MSIAAISLHTARLLLRIRWLAWGAIAALLVAHGYAAVTTARDAEAMTLTKVAARPGAACGCPSSGTTV